VRMPKIRRWHARFRRRLKRSGGDPKWERWLPQNRLTCDQVPCNLRAGDGRTYDDVVTSHIWLAGAKADDGKRFCTLHVLARAHNGDSLLPRHGQPKLGLIFRGLGVRVSKAERVGYHPDVNVRFQKKAWAEEFAGKELNEATARSRARGERSVCIFDNLSGQTTKEHLRSCLRARCDRHLLPTRSTGELMLIDGGIGAHLKHLLGEETDGWLEEAGNLERWTNGPKTGGLHAWEKRVLVTQLAGRACAGRSSARATTSSLRRAAWAC
jgi:hypothetical protein